MPHEAGHSVWGYGGQRATAPWGGPTQTPWTAEDVGASLIPGDIAGYRTPDMDWQDLMRNVGRTWSSRVPLRDMRNQLESRYQLRGPTGGFSEFLGDYTPLGSEGLRARATEAQRIGGMTQDEYGSYLASVGGPGSDLGLQATSLRGYFDPVASGGLQNQLAAANLLAQQRTGGGQWQGRMAEGIADAMESMYSSRFGAGYDPGTFLDWYLGATAPTTS